MESFPTFGSSLLESDFLRLEACWINREMAQRAMLRRVTSSEGAAIVGRTGRGDYAGILFPYVLPGQNQIREYRLRRDHPDYEMDQQGRLKEKGKYLSPPGRGNILYFLPGTPAEWLDEEVLPVAIVEGEKKALALSRLAFYEISCPRFMPVGLPGVWNWRGTVGKTIGPNGERCDVKGPIPDLDRISWAKRRAFVVFDANVRTNESVAAARLKLSQELVRRGADVLWLELPDLRSVNGIDDLLAVLGPDAVLPLFDDARSFKPKFNTTDYGNAERLTTYHGTNIRYCGAWRKWLGWDGKRWVVDENGEVVRLAKRTVRSIYREAADTEDDQRREHVTKWARESEKAMKITAMIKLAESEPGIPISPGELDNDQYLLNCLNCTVDLRTGEARPYRPEDRITKLAPVEYIPTACCPRWNQFLGEIFARHPDVIPFIQRAVGYTLTGDRRDECLFLRWAITR